MASEWTRERDNAAMILDPPPDLYTTTRVRWESWRDAVAKLLDENATLRRRIEELEHIRDHSMSLQTDANERELMLAARVEELEPCAAESQRMEAALRTVVEALRAIEDAPTEWGEGVDANMERVRSLARTALTIIGDAAKEPENE